MIPPSACQPWRVDASRPCRTSTEAQASYHAPRHDQEAAAKVVKVVAERIPARFGLNAIRDVQVLCPMNRGSAGARALNTALEALNPAKPGQSSVERFGFIFRVFDQVMQTENNYDRDVFNGDLGFIAAIEMASTPANRNDRYSSPQYRSSGKFHKTFDVRSSILTIASIEPTAVCLYK